jgi:anti-anti-sigma factor
MTFEIRHLEDDVVVIELSGRLDTAWAQGDELRFTAVASSQRKVIIDLSEVSYLASLGIRSLVLSAKAVRSKGGRIALANPQSMVRQVLVSSGMDAVLPLSDSLDDALAQLRD